MTSIDLPVGVDIRGRDGVYLAVIGAKGDTYELSEWDSF